MEMQVFKYESYWQDALSYAEYRALIDHLLSEGKSTGSNQSEELTRYSELNVVRMKRLDKTTVVSEPLSEMLDRLEQKPLILTITEGWCGDAAQIVPVIEKVALENGLQTRYSLRDENPELMNRHLTNGSKSIPIIVFLHPESFELMASWGPRPLPPQQMMQDWKKLSEPKTDLAEVKKGIQLWYARDKQATMQEEWKSVLAEQ